MVDIVVKLVRQETGSTWKGLYLAFTFIQQKKLWVCIYSPVTEDYYNYKSKSDTYFLNFN